MTGKELTVSQPSDFAIISDPQSRELMSMAVSDLGVGTFQLQRLKVPGSGGLAWEVPTVSGMDIAREIDVVVVGMRGNQRAWYRESFEGSGGGSRPDCFSTNGIDGRGNRELEPETEEDGNREQFDYECAACPWNQFGSARFGGGTGKDCSESIYLYFFTTESRLPMLLVVPTMSLRAVKDYMLKLVSFGRHVSSVVTRLSLENEENAAGIKYSKLVLSHVADLEADQQKHMADLASEFKQRVIDTVDISNLDA